MFVDRENLIPDEAAGSSVLDELLLYAGTNLDTVLIAFAYSHTESIQKEKRIRLLFFSLLITIETVAAVQQRFLLSGLERRSSRKRGM
jgi:hypothetical protein